MERETLWHVVGRIATDEGFYDALVATLPANPPPGPRSMATAKELHDLVNGQLGYGLTRGEMMELFGFVIKANAADPQILADTRAYWSAVAGDRELCTLVGLLAIDGGLLGEVRSQSAAEVQATIRSRVGIEIDLETARSARELCTQSSCDALAAFRQVLWEVGSCTPAVTYAAGFNYCNYPDAADFLASLIDAVETVATGGATTQNLAALLTEAETVASAFGISFEIPEIERRVA